MTFDTSARMNINRSTLKLIALIAACFVFIAVGIYLINGGAVETKGEQTIIVGWVCTIFTCFCALEWLRRLIFGERVPLVLTASGLHYKYASKAEIKWSTLKGLSVWTHKGSSFVCLEIVPEEFDKVQLTWSGRVVELLNKPFFKKSQIYISSSDLQISFSELNAAIDAYARAHNISLVSKA